MWYDDQITNLTDQIDQMTLLRDQPSPTGHSQRASVDAQLAALTRRRDAFQANRAEFADIQRQLDTASAKHEAAMHQVIHYMRSTRNLEGLTIIAIMIAMILAVLSSSTALLMTYCACIFAATGVIVYRIGRLQHLARIEDAAHAARTNALERRNALVARIDGDELTEM